MATQYKIITDLKDMEAKVKDMGNLLGDVESKVNALAADGWEVVGAGPERNALLKRHLVVELLRKLPILNIIMNWLFPQLITSNISIILKKD